MNFNQQCKIFVVQSKEEGDVQKKTLKILKIYFFSLDTQYFALKLRPFADL